MRKAVNIICGILAEVCALAIWILLDAIGWMCSHDRMADYWR